MNESATYPEPEEAKSDEQAEKDSPVPMEDTMAVPSELDRAETAADLIDTAPLDPWFDDPQEPTPAEETSTIIGQPIGALSAPEPRLKVAKRCDVGAIRERNEDSCHVFASETGGHFALMPFGLYIVADGMGGHSNGHVASKIASRVAARHIISQIYVPLLQSEEVTNQKPIQEVLTEAVQAANTAVYEYEPDNDSGTTLSIALILSRRLYIAHVGDSRIYLFANDNLETITNDHSLVQRLQDVGHLTAEEATLYRYRHVLLRAVGQGEELEIDTYMRSLPKTGKLLLCSDGLCGLISDATIQEIMRQDLRLEQTVDQLFEAAMKAGGYDNITIILVDFAV
jgi:protein phosphatase